MKWASEYWGIEIIAENENNAKILSDFVAKIPPVSFRDYSCYGEQNEYQIDKESHIVSEFYGVNKSRFPLVLRFHRGY